MTTPLSAPRRRHPRVESRRAEALATLPHPIFSAADARLAGLTAADLRSTAVVSLRRGVFTTAQTPITLPLRCAAALMGQSDDVRISHLTAAELWHLPAPTTDRLQLSHPAQPRRTLTGTIAHRQVPGSQRAQLFCPGVGRLPVSDPVGVVLECAPLVTLVELVVLADAVLAHPRTDAADATNRWRQARGPQARIVHDAAERARNGAESPPETRTRLLLELAGLPLLTVQHEVTVAGRRRRFDLAYPELRIAVEYDGSYHYATEAQKQADIVREDELRQAGWIIIRVVSHGLYRDPASTIARVVHALAVRGVDVAVTPTWTLHFAQRAR